MALQADAWHLRTDVYTSAGVMGGLALIWVGHRAFPTVDLDWLDPLAGIGVAVLIMRAAYRLTIDAARDLMDASLDEEEVWIRDYIAELKPTIRAYHKLRTRKAGPTRFVDVHVLVDSDMHLDRAHEISQQLEDAIEGRFPGTNVTVHMEPCNAACEPSCQSDCLLAPGERESLSGK